MSKPEYLKSLESSVFLSVMDCGVISGDFLNYMSEKRFSRVYEQSDFKSDTNNVIFTEVIFKSKQGFYLVVKYSGLIREIIAFSLAIYYEVEKYNELYLFISQLLKDYNTKKYNGYNI